jgi:hypothetical protein
MRAVTVRRADQRRPDVVEFTHAVVLPVLRAAQQTVTQGSHTKKKFFFVVRGQVTRENPNDTHTDTHTQTHRHTQTHTDTHRHTNNRTNNTNNTRQKNNRENSIPFHTQL